MSKLETLEGPKEDRSKTHAFGIHGQTLINHYSDGRVGATFGMELYCDGQFGEREARLLVRYLQHRLLELVNDEGPGYLPMKVGSIKTQSNLLRVKGKEEPFKDITATGGARIFGLFECGVDLEKIQSLRWFLRERAMSVEFSVGSVVWVKGDSGTIGISTRAYHGNETPESMPQRDLNIKTATEPEPLNRAAYGKDVLKSALDKLFKQLEEMSKDELKAIVTIDDRTLKMIVLTLLETNKVKYVQDSTSLRWSNNAGSIQQCTDLTNQEVERALSILVEEGLLEAHSYSEGENNKKYYILTSKAKGAVPEEFVAQSPIYIDLYKEPLNLNSISNRGLV